MLQLHEDPNFHYEAVRTLGLTRFMAADVTEVLTILPRIKPGDFEGWFTEWHNLAKRVLSSIDESKADSYSPITLRDVYFRASHYFFTAAFFLHGVPSDPRNKESFELSRIYYDKANAQLSIPGQHALLKTAHGFDIPIIVYRAASASSTNPRPTLIAGGGFDSDMGEMMHAVGFAALERGYNVVIYDGPGQPSLIHDQGKGWVADWEKVVSPIVDHLEAGSESGELAFIDTKKIGLIGMSLGGYLSARAAAFEPRLAAVICYNGVYAFEQAVYKGFPDCQAAWAEQDFAAFRANFENTTSQSPTGRRWIHDQLKFSMCMTDSVECMQMVCKMTMEGLANKIKMPAFIGLAEEDIFFFGQPEKIAAAIGDNATLFHFKADQGAALHCQSGALVYMNQTHFEWFAKVVGA